MPFLNSVWFLEIVVAMYMYMYATPQHVAGLWHLLQQWFANDFHYHIQSDAVKYKAAAGCNLALFPGRTAWERG